jgi:hypothetical protein
VAARGKKTYSVSYISICTSQNQALKDVSWAISGCDH